MSIRVSVRLTSRYCLMATGLVLGLTAAGCSAPRGNVSGKVTYQGRALVYGSVMFLGKDNLPVTGLIEPDGTYTARGVLAGENQVAINSPDPDPPERVSKGGKREAPPVDRSKWFLIPSRYGDVRTSRLLFTVGSGENTFNIELE